jgi:hypothetical protein
MDNSNGPDDEITIDPLPALDIPILRAARAVAGRGPARAAYGERAAPDVAGLAPSRTSGHKR